MPYCHKPCYATLFGPKGKTHAVDISAPISEIKVDKGLCSIGLLKMNCNLVSGTEIINFQLAR